jgi:hypothetical protein
MQNPSHATRERVVKHLMLVDARLSRKACETTCALRWSPSPTLIRHSTSPASMAIGIDLLNFVDLEHASLVFVGAYFDLARTGPG